MKIYASIIFCFLFFSPTLFAYTFRGFPEINPLFPKDLNTLTLVKDLNGAFLVRDTQSNQLFVLKTNPLAEAMKEEILADALYRKLGIPVPDFATYRFDISIPILQSIEQFNPNSPVRLSLYIEEHPDSKSEALRASEITFLKKHFIVDAYLSNWDITASKIRTNTLIDSNKTVWRIDNGGSLLRRAKGLLKRECENWSLKTVSELQTLLDPKISPGGASTYGALTKDEIEKQIIWLLSKSEDIFNTFQDLNRKLNFRHYNKLFQFLTHRLDDLRELAHTSEGLASPSITRVFGADPYKRVNSTNDCVFLCLYSHQHDIPQIFIGTSAEDNLWTFPGGNTLESDTYFFESAARWLSFDTEGKIVLSAADICNAPFHEMVINGKIMRLYFVQMKGTQSSPISVQGLSNKNRTFSRLTWLPLTFITDNIKNSRRSKDTETASTQSSPRSPRFDSLLQQIFNDPVITNILTIIENREKLPNIKLRNYHTQEVKPVPGRLNKFPTDVSLKGNFSRFNDSYILAQKVLAKGQVVAAIKSNTARLNTKQARSKTLNEEFTGIRAARLDFYKPYPPIPSLAQCILQLTSLTQTQVYLKKVMGSAFRTQNAGETPHNYAQSLLRTYCTSYSQLLKTIGKDKDYISQLAEVLSAELLYPGKCVFYHATSTEMAFMYDLFTEFRRQLMLTNLNENHALRAVDHAFFEIRNIQQFYDYFSNQSNTAVNYACIENRSYADQGLSVNCFLVGSDYWETSCSPYMFYHGHSKNPPDFNTLYSTLCRALRFKGDFTKLKRLYEHYLVPQGHKSNAALLQFFIEPSVVDQVAYMAVPGGRKLDYTLPNLPKGYFGAWEFLRHIREDTNLILLETKEPLVNIQARLFLHPEIMLNPQRTSSRLYWRHPLTPRQESTYREGLTKFVSDELTRMLTTYTQSPIPAFCTDTHYPSTTGTTGVPNDPTPHTHAETVNTFPLLRLHQKVSHDILGLSPNPNEDRDDYIRLITQGCSEEGLKEFLEHAPNVNVNAEIMIKVGTSDTLETYHPISFFITRQEFRQAILLFRHKTFDHDSWEEECDLIKDAFLNWLLEQLDWTVENFLFLVKVSPKAVSCSSTQQILQLFNQTLPLYRLDLWRKVVMVLDPENPTTHAFYRASCKYLMDQNNNDDLLSLVKVEDFNQCLDLETYKELFSYLLKWSFHTEASKIFELEIDFPLTAPELVKIFESCSIYSILTFNTLHAREYCSPNLAFALVTTAIKRNCPSLLRSCIAYIDGNGIITDKGERPLDLFAKNLLLSPYGFERTLDNYEECLDILFEHCTEIENPLSQEGSILQILCGTGFPPTSESEPCKLFEIIYLKLLSAGANPHGQPSKNLMPPLYTAIKLESLAIIEALLEKGADPTLCFRTPPDDASIFARSYPPCSIFVEGLFMFHFLHKTDSITFQRFVHRAYAFDPVSFTHITNLIIMNTQIEKGMKDYIQSAFPKRYPSQLALKERLEFYITHHCPHELENLLKSNPNLKLDQVSNSRMIVNGYKPKRLPALILAGQDIVILRLLMGAGAKIIDNHPSYTTEFNKISRLINQKEESGLNDNL